MKRNGWLIAAVIFAFGCLFQIVSLVRYLGRLPEDSLGIGLHVALIILFAVCAIVYYILWLKEKRKS